ncbi:MAG: tyrosine-protein phosphatase [Cyclobacteriaceae bacterium]
MLIPHNLSLLIVYFIGTLLLSSCRSLSPFDATYPANPVAQETPVYRDEKGTIIINIALLPNQPSLPVSIYQGHSAEEINRNQPIGTTENYTFLWKPDDEVFQHFFTIVDSNEEEVTVAERRIYFKGTDNTRDLGGYRTQDGRTVRWGKLYRSDDLNGLNKSDWNYWKNVGIRTVIDFREPDALERKPDNLPDQETPKVRHLAVYDTATTRKEYRRLLQKSDPEEYNTEQILIDNNELYVRHYTDSFALAVQEVLMQDEPLLYHCSAGKDRTGFMSAMLLLTLGVPQETIMRDYMASNYYRQKRIKKRANLGPLIGIAPYTSLPLLEVRPVYLQTAFRTIEDEYGSLENYIRQGLGISAADQEKLRQEYLF